ncbi:MAG: Hsp20/alpha crystallin family protein [Oligoflexia bacterium]|nr:Hsp20/alpha crystallin family protein [Oligoflexia bacterium]
MDNQELIAKEKTELKEIDKNEKTRTYKIFAPDVDISENKELITMVVEMPGVSKNNVTIKLENDVLNINGKINSDNYKDMRAIYSEYNIGHYERNFNLSESIDKGNIKAKMENGVLTLILPKSKEENIKARVISIQ